jgi:hypothetical protein
MPAGLVPAPFPPCGNPDTTMSVAAPLTTLADCAEWFLDRKNPPSEAE